MNNPGDDLESLRSTIEGIRALRAKYDGNAKYDEMKRRRELQKLRQLQKASKRDSDQPKPVPKQQVNKEQRKCKPKPSQPKPSSCIKTGDASTTSVASSDESDDGMPSQKLYYTVSTSVKEAQLGLDDPIKCNSVILASPAQYVIEQDIINENKNLDLEIRQIKARVKALSHQSKESEGHLVLLTSKAAHLAVPATDIEAQLQQVYAQVESNKRVLEAQHLRRESIRKEVESASSKELVSLNDSIALARDDLTRAANKYHEGELVFEYEANMNKIRSDRLEQLKIELRKLQAELGPAALSLESDEGICYCLKSNKQKKLSVIELINGHLKTLSKEEADLVHLVATVKKGGAVTSLLDTNQALKKKLITKLQNLVSKQ